MTMSRLRAETADRGYWSSGGVPRKGWRLVDVYDLGPNESQLCDMCQHARPRFIHVVEHDEVERPFEVGCICAEHMTQDYVNPRRREEALRSLAGRRQRFSRRRQWRQSKKGNPYIEVDDHLVVLGKARNGLFRISIKQPDDTWVHGRKTFATEHEAMLAGFDGVQFLKGGGK